MQKLLIALLMATATTTALALDPIPDKPGLSGFVNLGVAAGELDSNFFAKIGDWISTWAQI